MLTITILKGLPASGKSTWAKKKVMEYPNTVIVNRDKIREMLKGEYKNFPFGSSMEELVTRIEQSSIKLAMVLQYNIIIDATNFRLPSRWLSDLTFIYEYNIETIDFTDVTVEECIKRDSKREFPIGEKVIRKMEQKYLKKD